MSWPEHQEALPARHPTGFKRDSPSPYPGANPIGSGERWNAPTTPPPIDAGARRSLQQRAPGSLCADEQRTCSGVSPPAQAARGHALFALADSAGPGGSHHLHVRCWLPCDSPHAAAWPKPATPSASLRASRKACVRRLQGTNSERADPASSDACFAGAKKASARDHPALPGIVRSGRELGHSETPACQRSSADLAWVAAWPLLRFVQLDSELRLDRPAADRRFRREAAAWGCAPADRLYERGRDVKCGLRL
jgi:hypothetical protein